MFVLLAICLPRQGLLSYHTGESIGEIDTCVFVYSSSSKFFIMGFPNKRFKFIDYSELLFKREP